MININIIRKIKIPMQIKIFNIVIRVIYLVVSNEFVYENQFVIEIDTHKKFVEQNKSKKNIMQSCTY